ncbi:MAG: sensor domain-containing diguanylate cyclase [Thermoleophilia bacterium]|nr:sensor domain-containing diguanylate cyclase [Thermoleophilia bacterium]
MRRAAVKLNSENLRTILDQVAEGVYVLDTDDRIVLWNAPCEILTGYTARETVGRRCSDELLMHVDGAGHRLCFDSCPMKAARDDGQPRQAEVFLRHKEGHRVPVRVHISPLRASTGEILGAVQSFVDISDKIAALEQVRRLQDLAYLDTLTGLANRRFLEEALEARLNESGRYGWTLGVIMMDIDHFKTINDTYGHEAGERVLQTVARTLRGATRSYDLVGRWGGEEFLAILSRTSREDLSSIAERYRALAEQSDVRIRGGRLRVTLSLGAALADRSGETPAALVARADELLYQSKRAGRNRVAVETSALQYG